LDLLSDADALTTTEALDALARICALATRALPVKAEVERAAILSERRVKVCCRVQEWSRSGNGSGLEPYNYACCASADVILALLLGRRARR
jgi:hypothetical protein